MEHHHHEQWTREEEPSNKKTPWWQIVIVLCIVVGVTAGAVLALRNSYVTYGNGNGRNRWAGSTCKNVQAAPLEIIISDNSNLTEAPPEEIIILRNDEKLFSDQGVSSPNGKYCLELTSEGDLVLSMKTMTIETTNTTGKNSSTNSTLGNQTTTTKMTTTILWQQLHQRGINNTRGRDGATLSMQEDGNLVFRGPEPTNFVIWSSSTSKEPGASLRLDDNGRLAVISKDGRTALWMQGIPAGTYVLGQQRQSTSLTLPIRGIFYYPWFPETWGVDGNPVFYQPTEGKYSNGNQTLQRRHVEALQYAHIDLSIASWWGPGRKNDRARITNLMDESLIANNNSAGVKWSVYHEQERRLLPSVTELKADLAYLTKWFVWHEGWAFIDGKPAIFVYNAGGCDVSRRWVEAANCEWFVVLKLFRGYKECPHQPEGWHQYGPSSGAIHTEGFAYSISPGFWAADEDGPRLSRLSKDKFRADTQAMVDSREPLQLIATFNEWGEGTSVESAAEWASPSGQGDYMDVLHEVW